MKILALESSTVAASCCVFEDSVCIAHSSVNTKLTHSRTLMPMVTSMLENAEISLNDIDYIAIAAGPGSFTGVRIGVSAVKGLAFTNDTPCVSVSTLDGIANLAKSLPFNGLVCPLMDARCQQVYTSLFQSENGVLTKIHNDEALAASDMKNILLEKNQPVLLIGDGAKLCYSLWKEEIPNLFLAPISHRFPDAIGVAIVAEEMIARNETVSAEQLLPIYLRLPQAERELKAKKMS